MRGRQGKIVKEGKERRRKELRRGDKRVKGKKRLCCNC